MTSRGARVGLVPQEVPPVLWSHTLRNAVLEALPDEQRTSEAWRADMVLDSLEAPQALRGLDVRVLTPEKADSRPVQLAAYAFFELLGAAGARFFFYAPGFMHQKVLLIDDDFASVGTANFDDRSFRLNFEIIAAVPDRDFAADVERMLEDDLTRCRPIEKEEYTGRSFWFRLKVRVSYLLSQVM